MSDLATRSLKFTYTNWRGKTAERWATPLSFRWGVTDWHPEPGWLMLAFDHEKGAEREFALKDCVFARPAPVAEVKPTTVEQAARVLLDACPNPIFDRLKPVLIGEFSQQYPFIDEDGEERTANVNVSWVVTKDIIEATLRALAGGGHE